MITRRKCEKVGGGSISKGKMFSDLWIMEKRPRQVLCIGEEDELPARLKTSFFAAGTRISCGPKTDLAWRDFLEEEGGGGDNKLQLENILYLLFWVKGDLKLPAECCSI